MASTYLQRNMANSLTTDWTVSMWVKRNEIVRQQMLFSAYNNSSYDTEAFFDGDKLNFRNKRNGSFVFQVKTNRLFRDTNAWYHLVFQFHASGDSGVYAKIFVNGVQETDLNVNTQGSGETTWNNDKSHSIGSTVNGGADHFNGIISHMHFASTGIYAPTVFGETDATTGEWKIKTSPTFTLGSNGFTILKDGNTITDQSSNSNNFSLGAGTLTKTEDCPSNVFCTWNPLNSYYGGGTFSWGNNKIVLPNKNGAWNTGTLGMTSGKYYWEIKVGGDANGGEVQVGIADKSPNGNSSGSTAGTSFGYNSNGEYGIYAWNGAFIGNAVPNSYTAYGATSCEDGYIMIAVDLDNNKFYGGVNGTWFGSGNPSTGTNGKTIQAVADTVDGVYYPAVSTYQGYSGTVETNFGNGYFADNAVSSAGTNASGNGIFKYDVPTGFTALSTKGLNE